MKTYKMKLSKRQRINFYRAFIMLNKQEFGGRMGFDGFHHCYSMTPEPGTDNAFDLYLENTENPRGTVVAHVIVDSVERLHVTYYGVLSDGSRICGTLAELAGMDLQWLSAASDKTTFGLLLLKGSTECDPALLEGWEPTTNETMKQVEELGKQWAREDGADGGEMARFLAADALRERHEYLMREYVYDPGEDGSARTMNEDEQLMLGYIFIKAVTAEVVSLKRFSLGSGVIFWDEDNDCPCGQCYAVDLEGKEQVIGIQVTGPLNNPGEISFFCSNKEKTGLVFFPTALEAVASPLSIVQKKRPG